MYKSENVKKFLSDIRKELNYDKQFQITAQLESFLKYLPEQDQKIATRIWQNREKMTVGEVYDELIIEYIKEFVPLLYNNEIEIFTNTFWAIYPSGTFTGLTGILLTGERIILLNEGLVHSISTIAHWFCYMIENDSLKPHIINQEEEYNFSKYLYAIWNAKPEVIHAYPTMYPKSYDMWHLNELLTMGAIIFIMGHEFGHVLNGDSGDKGSRLLNYNKEYNADKFGLEFVIRYMMYHTASEIFPDTYLIKFSLFSVFLALSSIALYNPNQSDTHPSALMRISKVTEHYPKLLQQYFNKEYKEFSKTWCDEDDIIHLLNVINKKFYTNCLRINRNILEFEKEYGKTKPSSEFLTKFKLQFN